MGSEMCIRDRLRRARRLPRAHGARRGRAGPLPRHRAQPAQGRAIHLHQLCGVRECQSSADGARLVAAVLRSRRARTHSSQSRDLHWCLARFSQQPVMFVPGCGVRVCAWPCPGATDRGLSRYVVGSVAHCGAAVPSAPPRVSMRPYLVSLAFRNCFILFRKHQGQRQPPCPRPDSRSYTTPRKAPTRLSGAYTCRKHMHTHRRAPAGHIMAPDLLARAASALAEIARPRSDARSGLACRRSSSPRLSRLQRWIEHRSPGKKRLH